jgi:hypothetical protein
MVPAVSSVPSFVVAVAFPGNPSGRRLVDMRELDPYRGMLLLYVRYCTKYTGDCLGGTGGCPAYDGKNHRELRMFAEYKVTHKSILPLPGKP